MGSSVAAQFLVLLFIVIIGVSWSSRVASAEGGEALAYDISWPQCPNTFPAGDFEFAVIGLTGGRPFTSNKCFTTQYEWARTAQAHPDVYINLDFPRQGRPEAASGPYGVCGEFDQWCRGYNYGYNLGKDAVLRAQAHGVTPGRYWFDVEMDNYWTNWAPHNAQVVRGALDYFLDFHVPIGIYGTRYQWGLITGGLEAPGRLPLWVAGATTREMAAARCRNENLTFAGGETWMVQYYPEQGFDGNVLCDLARQRTAQAADHENALSATTGREPATTTGRVATTESEAPTAREAPTPSGALTTMQPAEGLQAASLLAEPAGVARTLAEVRRILSR